MSSPISIDRGPVTDPRVGRAEHPALAQLIELVTLRARRRLTWLARVREASEALDDPQVEWRFYAEFEALAPIGARINQLEDALLDGEDPIGEIVQMFGLSERERDLLFACLAVELEPSLAELYAKLNGDPARRYVTEAMAARLFDHGRRRMWSAGGPLASWGLIHTTDLGPGRPAPITVDPQVVARLQAQLGLDAELVGCAELIPEQTPLRSWPLAALRARIERSLAAGQSLRVVLVGPQGCGRRSFAAAVASCFDAGALALDTGDIDDERWPELYVRARRIANMAGLIPVWHGPRIDRRWPRGVPPGPLQILVCEDPKPVRRLAGSVDELVVMPASDVDERLSLWRALVTSSRTWATRDVERLALRHRLVVGDIAEVGRRMPMTSEDAARMAREQTRGRLGELGRLLDCPFAWDDLVLAPELRNSLEDFAFEAAERVRFWESPGARRLFPRGVGLVGLLAGPPGTGKTMAAQVIAANLELDLFRINLSTVVSKYIGETAKNLDRIFTRATRMNAVLLFDEADSLFSKRTDVRDSHDRHANTDTNYLLQLLEDYEGIALLASNKKNNIDPAFIRRIRYVLDFRRPDANQRRTIWRRILRELIGAEILRELEPAIAVLAEAVELSGAQIKNAVLAAVFVARRRRRALDIEALMRGVDRELSKEGRGLSERERARLSRHV